MCFSVPDEIDDAIERLEEKLRERLALRRWPLISAETERAVAKSLRSLFELHGIRCSGNGDET
jgi:hypothetical protein